MPYRQVVSPTVITPKHPPLPAPAALRRPWSKTDADCVRRTSAPQEPPAPSYDCKVCEDAKRLPYLFDTYGITLACGCTKVGAASALG